MTQTEFKPGTKQRVGSGTKKKHRAGRTEPISEDNSFRGAIAWGMSTRSNGQVINGSRSRQIANYHRIVEKVRRKQARKDGFLRGNYLPTPKHGKKAQQAEARKNQRNDG